MPLSEMNVKNKNAKNGREWGYDYIDKLQVSEQKRDKIDMLDSYGFQFDII